MTSGIGKQFLDAQVEYMRAEGAVSDAIYESGVLADEDDLDDHHGDYYDGSFEVYITGETDAEMLAAFILSLGFHQCWIHRHKRDECPLRVRGMEGTCDAIHRVASTESES